MARKTLDTMTLDTLPVVRRQDKYTEQAAARAEAIPTAEKMVVVAEAQHAAKLGDKRAAAAAALEGAKLAAKTAAAVVAVAAEFAEVDATAIPETRYEGVAALPRFARIVRLAAHDRNVAVQLRRGAGVVQMTAAIPYMPPAALEAAARFREITADVASHIDIIWEAVWEERPVGDPLLLGCIAGHTFRLALWGGDADAIAEWVV